MLLELILLAAAVAAIAFYCNKRPEGFPPGPSGIPLLGYLPFLSKRPHEDLVELSKKYGSKVISVKVGKTRVVVLNGYQAIREAWKEDVFAGRPTIEIVDGRQGGHNKGLIFCYGNTWNEQRRFAMKGLRDIGYGRKVMEPVIHEEITEWIEGIKKDMQQPINLHTRFNVAILSSVWRLATGKSFNQRDNKIEKFCLDTIDSFYDMDNLLGTVFFVPWLGKLKPQWKKLDSYFSRTRQLMQEEINDHKKTYSEDSVRDLIDAYLKQVLETKDRQSSFYGSEGEHNALVCLMDLFVASAQMIENAITWACVYMMRYPDIQAKVHRELDDVIGRNRLPSVEDRPQLPYFEATTMEVLRCAATLPISFLHSTTHDTVFQGYRIPKDTPVAANYYSALSDQDHWGDPERFRPERFLTEDGKLHRDEAFLAFSYGKRNCVGEALAKDEIFLFFSSVMQNFNLSFVPGEPRPPLHGRNGGAVRQNAPFNAVFKERK